MRIYYKIHLTKDGSDADILSFAFHAEDGRSLYVEATDYQENSLSVWHKDHVASHLLGKRLKELVVAIPKLVAASTNVKNGAGKVKELLKPYPFLELVGRSNYHEMQALLWLISFGDEKRHVNLINISDEMLSKYGDTFKGVREELPDYNALRYALGYKHIAKKIGKNNGRRG